MALAWQPTLFEPPAATGSGTAVRTWLDGTAWVDHVPGYLTGHDEVFERLVARYRWEQRRRVVYEKEWAEPRLTWWPGRDEPWPDPLGVVVADLSARYGVAFDQVGANLYRDGRDSVAWHRDRVHRVLRQPLVATVTLGSARPFLLRTMHRPGASVRFVPEPGDLLVMGGDCQHTWQHTVPKVAVAGPRISVTVRHSAQGPVARG
jgi:alkylated DNA repair dioxygenase AlkB